MNHDVSALCVRESIILDFLGEAGHEGMLNAELVFDGRDPFAMSLVFDTTPRVVWTFGRDLLLQGLYEPAGDGDVQIWPGVTHAGMATLLFELSSPDGSITGQMDLRDCHAFITKMVAIVPVGAEADHVDVDGAIDALLKDAPDLSV